MGAGCSSSTAVVEAYPSRSISLGVSATMEPVSTASTKKHAVTLRSKDVERILANSTDLVILGDSPLLLDMFSVTGAVLGLRLFRSAPASEAIPAPILNHLMMIIALTAANNGSRMEEALHRYLEDSLRVDLAELRAQLQTTMTEPPVLHQPGKDKDRSVAVLQLKNLSRFVSDEDSEPITQDEEPPLPSLQQQEEQLLQKEQLKSHHQQHHSQQQQQQKDQGQNQQGQGRRDDAPRGKPPRRASSAGSTDPDPSPSLNPSPVPARHSRAGSYTSADDGRRQQPFLPLSLAKQQLVRVLCKGEAMDVLNLCTRYVRADGSVAPLSQERIAELRLLVKQWRVSESARATCLAFRDVDIAGRTFPPSRSMTEKKLIFVGLFKVLRPLRPAVHFLSSQCETLGLRCHFLTESPADEAASLALRAGLVSSQVAPMLGRDTITCPAEELVGTPVVAACLPDNALEFVTQLQSAGGIVVAVACTKEFSRAIARANAAAVPHLHLLRRKHADLTSLASVTVNDDSVLSLITAISRLKPLARTTLKLDPGKPIHLSPSIEPIEEVPKLKLLAKKKR